MKYVITILLLSLVNACASDHTNNWNGAVGWSGLFDQQKLYAGNHWAIDNDVDLYIAAPSNELLDDQFYDEFIGAFKRYYPKTLSSPQRVSLEEGFSSAQYAGMDYLVYPQIRARVTRKGFDMVASKEIKIGAMRRPALEMDILIYSANTQKIVDHLQITTKGGIFTADETQLLWLPLNDYLKKLSQYSALGS